MPRKSFDNGCFIGSGYVANLKSTVDIYYNSVKRIITVCHKDSGVVIIRSLEDFIPEEYDEILNKLMYREDASCAGN